MWKKILVTYILYVMYVCIVIQFAFTVLIWFGNILAKLFNPVPCDIAAVTAIILSSFCASFIRVSEKIFV